jgi:hypothetical protein
VEYECVDVRTIGVSAVSRVRIHKGSANLSDAPDDDLQDPGSMDDRGLRELVRALEAEELELSYARRILHGKVDILRAELVSRLRKKRDAGEDVIGFDDDDPPAPDGGVRQPRPRPPRGPGSLDAGAVVDPQAGDGCGDD